MFILNRQWKLLIMTEKIFDTKLINQVLKVKQIQASEYLSIAWMGTT